MPKMARNRARNHGATSKATQSNQIDADIFRLSLNKCKQTMRITLTRN